MLIHGLIAKLSGLSCTSLPKTLLCCVQNELKVDDLQYQTLVGAAASIKSVVMLQEDQQRKEKEEDAREQARLQAEQQKLKQQFAEEKEAEKAKRALESGVRDIL